MYSSMAADRRATCSWLYATFFPISHNVWYVSLNTCLFKILAVQKMFSVSFSCFAVTSTESVSEMGISIFGGHE
jgi:hypothetical protein